MGQHLALTIRLHATRYHGVAEWPPAPARVFQALVAGAAEGATLPSSAESALEWLEKLSAPTIASPRAWHGQALGLFVPNNDADSLGGDLSRLPDIRVKKAMRPRLLPEGEAFLYVWPIETPAPEADQLLEVSERLYQLGRGIDPAWAAAQVVDDQQAEHMLTEHRGVVHRPSNGAGPMTLACPTAGSLASLVVRHREAGARLRDEVVGKVSRVLFAQPPKPRFIEVAYDAPPTRLLYELRRGTSDNGYFPAPLWKVVALVQQLRDGAAARLRHALPARVGDIERVLIGRKRDGSDSGPVADRIRILPIPSTGHAHADHAMRRVAVFVPASSPLDARDVHWAFSGLEPSDAETGEIDIIVTPASDATMANRLVGPARSWRTLTPAALPDPATRRRIEPRRRRQDAKGATERSNEECAAVAAVHTALRHANISEPPISVTVQREPFDRKGMRAERFEPASKRFPKERLWHLQIEFREPVKGPIALGDGRFLGLGLLAPRSEHTATQDGLIALEITGGLLGKMDPIGAVRALRRAVMARAQARVGRRSLPTFLTGHEPDGHPARGDDHSTHVAFQADGARLWILAPHRLDRRAPNRDERAAWATLEDAIEGLSELRAGRLGVLELRRAVLGQDEALLRSAGTWRSCTPYCVQRHERAAGASEAVVLDVLGECVRRGLPRPEIMVRSVRAANGRGLEAGIELRFAIAISGPLVLGRTRFLGGGLFAPV